MNVHQYWIGECIRLAAENAKHGGGPFAALVLRDGKVIAEGINLVTQNNDPTAHAEIVAIRSACQKIKNFQLEDCIIYASCEPCPMCFGAIYWARPLELYYAASKEDAAAAGFDDHFIYEELNTKADKRKFPFRHVEHKDSLIPFQTWASNVGKKAY